MPTGSKPPDVGSALRPNQIPASRAALEDLALDFLRLAEGRGSETALTVDVQMERDGEQKLKH